MKDLHAQLILRPLVLDLTLGFNLQTWARLPTLPEIEAPFGYTLA